MWFDSNLQPTPELKRKLFPQIAWWNLQKLLKYPFRFMGVIK